MKRLLAAMAVAATAALAACSPNTGDAFHIVAGSEQKALEPIVQDFCQQKHQRCVVDYKGSLDIGLMLSGTEAPDVDAVWPASSLWIELYDKSHRVQGLKSVSQSPVILGVRMSKAKALGWIGARVTMDDVLKAVADRKLTFLMTSATQSNSGASAYLAMLAAAFGQEGRLDPRALDDAAAKAKVKTMLSGVARSSGSSGWLGELYVKAAQAGTPYDAMWNYEFVLKETNDALRAAGKEKLYAVYPAEGSAYADAPLGFVDRGGDKAKDRRAFFDALQAYMLSAPVQAKVAAEGRRTGLGAATPAAPEPDWNFDPRRTVPSIALPEPEVIARALALYQETLRRPSLTALCLDFSGSMEGKGEDQLHAAMRTLLTPSEAAQSLIQWTPADRIIVIPFDSEPRRTLEGDGSASSQARLLAAVDQESAGGGTDMYACARQAYAALAPYAAKGYLPALVMMTDGRSEGGRAFDRDWAAQGQGVPVFGVTFGSAQKDQLDHMAEATSGRVFDGGSDLTQAFRSARGYN